MKVEIGGENDKSGEFQNLRSEFGWLCCESEGNDFDKTGFAELL